VKRVPLPLPVLLLALTACSLVTFDGHPLVDCRDNTDCQARLPLAYGAAADWLDRTLPGHAAVDRGQVFDTQVKTSGPFVWIVVWTLRDGTTQAVDVTCGFGTNPENVPERCTADDGGTGATRLVLAGLRASRNGRPVQLTLRTMPKSTTESEVSEQVVGEP
jgi:hypothetical protein